VNAKSISAVAYLAVGFVIALVVHEYAHALVSSRLGDHAPRQQGRLSLNPQVHLDRFGSVVLPAILLLITLFDLSRAFVFGYAKPQPQNPWTLRRQDRHATFIALAGPAANVVLSFAFGALYRVSGSGELGRFIAACLLANVIMAAMNLIPIPPLDMARVVARTLPPKAREVMTNLEQYGALFMLLVFFVLSTPILGIVHVIGNGICQVTAGVSCF
jgi:Zn-dependent protease